MQDILTQSRVALWKCQVQFGYNPDQPNHNLNPFDVEPSSSKHHKKSDFGLALYRWTFAVKTKKWMSGALSMIWHRGQSKIERPHLATQPKQPSWTVHPELRRLEGMATEFRRLLRSAPHSSLPTSLHTFPFGAGIEAAFLLSMFLREVGYGRIFLVSAQRDSQRHVWLETAGVNVDISIDQFLDADRPKGFASEDHPWYKNWTIEEVVDANFLPLDLRTHQQLLRTYQAIVGVGDSPVHTEPAPTRPQAPSRQLV